MRHPHSAPLRWFYTATFAVCFVLAWQLGRGAVALREKGRFVSGSLGPLRAALASEIAAARDRGDDIAKRRAVFAERHQMAAPNRDRIVRMLRMLAADRRNLGPSEPIKVLMSYGTAALGFHGELLQNAAYAKAYRAIQRYQLETSCAPFLAQLAAQNVDGTRLIDLTLEWRNSPIEARAIASQEGLDGKLASEAADAASAASQREIENYIGGDNFATYRAYGAGQYIADQFQEHLSYAGTEMTAEQYARFSALVGTGGDRNLLEGTITDDAVLAAQAILTPSQLQVLQDYKREREGSN
jgi:hypothetical protein